MKILFASWQCNQIRAVGGTGGVTRDLLIELKNKGHKVALCMPFFAGLPKNLSPKKLIDHLPVELGTRQYADVYKDNIPGTDIPAYLLTGPGGNIFSQPYVSEMADSLSYIYASKLLPAAISRLSETGELAQPDVVHIQDVEFALAAPIIRSSYKGMDQVALVGTIHFGFKGHLGVTEKDILALAGLDRIVSARLRRNGKFHLLLGLDYCELINTVSAGYRDELAGGLVASGLEDWYARLWQEERFFGITNGLGAEWDRQKDNLIIRLQDETSEGVAAWKLANKRALQQKSGLPLADVPLIGMAARLAPEKFGSLLEFYGHERITVLEKLLSTTEAQFVILAVQGNNSKPKYATQLKDIAAKYPRRMFFVDGDWNNPIHHLIFAGSDLYSMPSTEEPCGTAQLSAMRYGSLPVVPPIGGLKGTVAQERGFLALSTSPADIHDAFLNGINCFNNDKAGFEQKKLNALNYDSSWQNSRFMYEKTLYQQAINKVKGII